jgi:hypothetical protein
MPLEPRLQYKDLVLSVPEFQQRTAQEGSPRTVTPTTMTTTTVVSAQLTSTHVGYYIIPEDGNIRGNPAQIKAFVSGTNTATIDRTWASTTGVTTLRLWQPPDIPIECTATGSTTSVVCSGHANITNEPDSTFVGMFLLAKTGANAGGAYKINGFTSATGTFDLTGDPLGTASALGDCFLIRKMLRPEAPVTMVVKRNAISRKIVGYADADQAVITNSSGTVDFPLPQRPLTTAASGLAVPPYEMGDILRDFMTETLDTGSTYSSQGGSTPTGITITVGSGAGFSVGGFALMSTGEASQITAISANVLTVPQCTAAANLAASVVYASAWYKRKLTGFYTRTIERYAGKLLRQALHGCAPSCELDIARDQVIKFMLKYTSPDAIEYNIADPNSLSGHKFSLADTTVPVDGKGARCMIDSIPVLIADAKIMFGPKPLLRASLSGMNQGDGYAFDFDPVKITMTGYLADNDDIASMPDIQDRFVLGNVLSLFYQKGTNPKETFCWSAPAAQITKSEFKYQGGQGVFDFEAECILPQAARGNSVSNLLPSFALGYL